MQLNGARVLVVGLGRSGRAAAQLCLRRGARVTLTDSREASAFGNSLDALAAQSTLELGGHRLASFKGSDLVVVSPGVPPLPELDAAKAAGIPVIGELELAYRHVQAPIVAITGTNGKSTVTTMVGQMLQASREHVFFGGNLGQPLSEIVDTPAASPDGLLVLELSSFQLERIERFHAQIAVLLNLSDDHLDRYPSFAAYANAKARLFERQTAADSVVVSGESDQVEARRLAHTSAARVLTFQIDGGRGQPHAWLDGDELCLRVEGAAVERYARDQLKLAGRHNTLNALAALLVARLAGASSDGCRTALAQFLALPHRMELVGEHHGVRFYDDSKATNVGAVVGSLAGFERKVVLIAGGKDKGGDYAPLRPVVREVCSHVVLLGAASDVIAAALDGVVPLHRARDMEHAVDLAANLATAGEAVVLSPACSSFDMFRDYTDRGRAFRQAVAQLDHK